MAKADILAVELIRRELSRGGGFKDLRYVYTEATDVSGGEKQSCVGQYIVLQPENTCPV